MSKRVFRLIGFTLIEMVVAISVLAVLGVMVATFISRPLEGYRDLARRAALVDTAETALRRLERDIRNALPNSVRVTSLSGGGYALELLPVLDGAMYRRRDGASIGNYNILSFTGDVNWDIHKFFRHITVPSTSTTHRIVINNQGPSATDTRNDAYRATGNTAVITPVGTTITYDTSGGPGAGDGTHHINLSATHDFSVSGSGSARQRLYIIETPVTYLCIPNATDPSLGTLIRYAGYAINLSSNQPTNPAAAPLATATSARIADNVSACSFNTTTLEIMNRMLATLLLTIEDQDEKASLIHQVHINNSL